MSNKEKVDQALIAAANEHHAAQVKRLSEAAAALQVEQKAHEAALQASADADRGVGPLNAFDAETGVEEAARRRRVAERVHEAAQRAVKEAEGGQRAAEGKAWRGVYLDGVRRRIAAARAGEAARLALDAADREHDEATRALDEAQNHGTIGVEYVNQKQRRLGTEEEELKLWTSNGFDPIKGTYLHWI